MDDPRIYDGGRELGLGTKLLLVAFAIGTVTMGTLIGISILVPRFVDRAIGTYTDPEPAVAAAEPVPEAEREAIEARVNDYEKALDAGEAREPLVLTEREVNALLAGEIKERDEGLLGVRLLPGRVRAQLSMRLTQTLPLGPWSRDLNGRYVNGEATFDAAVRDRRLELRLTAFEVKGRHLPEFVLEILRDEIDRSRALEDEGLRDFVNKIGALEFGDGQAIITPPPR